VGDSSGQILQRIRKVQGQPQTVDLTECRFVPLLGAQAEDD